MRKFYDAHCHMMNLSHPNLSVMLKRIFRELGVIDRMKISLGTFLFAIPFIGKALPSLFKVDERVMNLLTVMETYFTTLRSGATGGCKHFFAKRTTMHTCN